MGFTILILDYGMRPGDVSRDSPLELQWSKLIHDFFTLRNQWILGALNDLRQEHWSTEDETMDVEPRRVSHMDSILFIEYLYILVYLGLSPFGRNNGK